MRTPRRLRWCAALLGLALLAACNDGDQGGAASDGPRTGAGVRDGSVRLVDAAAPDVEPDVAFIEDCLDGETRPCGTDEGLCEAGIEACALGLWTGRCEGETAGTDERCNGLDDDCDGGVDEGLGVGSNCKLEDERHLQIDGVIACDALTGDAVCAELPDCDTDADGDGVNVCQDCDDEDRGNFPGNEERCDGRDNDCDQRIDEPFALGEVCRAGEGVCRRGGHTVCDAVGAGVTCDAVPLEPTGAELCGNGEDDDCDGSADEGFDIGGACDAGQGACRVEGSWACSADLTEVLCAADVSGGGGELCSNGVDDDCDGAIDEGFLLGQACAVGEGACRREGITACSADGRATACSAAPGVAGVERCGDGLDDDCDGRTDEGFDLARVCTTGVGACARQGLTVCNVAGDQAVCGAEAGTPVAERCGNQQDDDCDGDVDEGFSVDQICAAGTGQCARDGLTRCSADGISVECGAQPGAPGLERCDGHDEDCDGQVDEGFALGEICSAGEGRCAAEGRRVCGAMGDAVCTAQALPPLAERCNGVDDDCDGRADEDFVGLGEACDSDDADRCALGTLQCDPGGGDAVCVDDVPQFEVCDYEDNDCDGVADNGIDIFTDPLNCGDCGLVCPGPGPECIDGACYRTYWISAGQGSNATGDGSRANPWRTLTHADGIVRGPRARIYVGAGTYSTTMHATEVESFPVTPPDQVQVVGDPAADRSAIVFQGSGVHRLVVYVGKRSATNLFAHVTLRGGGAVAQGTLYVSDAVLAMRDVHVDQAITPSGFSMGEVLDSTLTFEQGRVSGCSSTLQLGLLFANRSTVTVRRTQFEDNVAGGDSYGLIRADQSTLAVENCAFVNNRGNAVTAFSGGAVLSFVHNTVAGHTGLGVFVASGTHGLLANNVFAHNTDGGVLVEVGGVLDGAYNNLFWMNAQRDWGGGGANSVDTLNALPVAAGNFEGDPLFISLPAANVRLRAGSACVDRADPDFALDVDLAGRARPRGAFADVGAYESTLEP